MTGEEALEGDEMTSPSHLPLEGKERTKIRQKSRRTHSLHSLPDGENGKRLERTSYFARLEKKSTDKEGRRICSTMHYDSTTKI